MLVINLQENKFFARKKVKLFSKETNDLKKEKSSGEDCSIILCLQMY